MTSDDTRKPADTAFRTAGVGLSVAQRCWRCGHPKPRLGGKMLTKAKLFHCAQCVPAKAAA